MLTFNAERVEDWKRDADWLFPVHYEELALDKEIATLDLSFERYFQAEQQGQLLIATARSEEGKLVGYYVAALLPHLHYQSAGLMAHTDMYFLHPDYRIGGNGVKFLLFVEELLRRMGIVKLYVSTKLHSDHSALFEGLGFRATDKVFTKRLR